MEMQQLIKRICEVPQMYVSSPTFESVAAFISGYNFAFTQLSEANGDNTGMAGFRQWLGNRCWRAHRWPSNMGWDYYIQRLYPEDEDALAQLPVLFDQYLVWKSKQRHKK